MPDNTRNVFSVVCEKLFMRAFILKRNISTTFKDFRIIREEPGLQIDIIINDVKITWFSAGTIAVKFRTGDYSFRYGNIYS